MALSRAVNLLLSRALQLSPLLVADIHAVGLGLHMKCTDDYESPHTALISTKCPSVEEGRVWAECILCVMKFQQNLFVRYIRDYGEFPHAPTGGNANIPLFSGSAPCNSKALSKLPGNVELLHPSHPPPPTIHLRLR